MQGKTVVITGATSGIGEVAAVELAPSGRADRFRRAQSFAPRYDAGGGCRSVNDKVQAHGVISADLSRLSEMKRVGGRDRRRRAQDRRAHQQCRRSVHQTRGRTSGRSGDDLRHQPSGIFRGDQSAARESQGHAGLRASSGTSSDAHKSGKLNFDDLQSEKSYVGFRVYCDGKLENILFTRELARRIAGTGVTANCLHPGFVASSFGDNNGGWTEFAFGLLKKIAAISPEDGAKTIVYLASSPDIAGQSGGYYYKCAPSTPTAAAQNDADAKRLWEISAKIAGVG